MAVSKELKAIAGALQGRGPVNASASDGMDRIIKGVVQKADKSVDDVWSVLEDLKSVVMDDDQESRRLLSELNGLFERFDKQ